MPMILVETIDSHHRDLLRALGEVEELVAASAPADELAAAVEGVRHSLLAHEATAERFLVAPLRRLQLVNNRELDALGDERDRLSQDALQLTSGEPAAEALDAFVRRVREHIARKARAVEAAARYAVAERRLSAVPRWCIDEVYEGQGGPGTRPSEEWLG